MADQKKDISWSNYFEAAMLIMKGKTFPTASRVALVVGIILCGINEGSLLLNGKISYAIGVRLFLNFLVPYVVSSIGYMAPFRQQRN